MYKQNIKRQIGIKQLSIYSRNHTNMLYVHVLKV